MPRLHLPSHPAQSISPLIRISITPTTTAFKSPSPSPGHSTTSTTTTTNRTSFSTSSIRKYATPLPITAAGPPPSAPSPTSSSSSQASSSSRPEYAERVAQRRRQADLLKRGKDLRDQHATGGLGTGKQDGASKTSSLMKKRFWNDVQVVPLSESQQQQQSGYTISLDGKRPVKNPLLLATSTPLIIPDSKPWLATAIAMEWDALPTAQHALRPHLLPLTGIASRAQALALEDARANSAGGANTSGKRGGTTGIRDDIIKTVLRYLDTDTLLCFSPPQEFASSFESAAPSTLGATGSSLRDLQIRIATPIISYLTTSLWPGVELVPALDGDGGDGASDSESSSGGFVGGGVSIIPRSQPSQTHAVIRGWLTGLNAWDLVGLERAVLAGKSLCVGARLVGEWSQSLNAAGASSHPLTSSNSPGTPGNANTANAAATRVAGRGREAKFGVDEAVEACTLEVRWQTDRWGEVEDTHDVDREDVRRQMGMAVLVVSGIFGGDASQGRIL